MSESGTRESLRHALGAALERAERAEAAAEEARQERDRAQRVVEGFKVTTTAQARQLADELLRIRELEAALRDAAEFLEGAHVHHGSESVKLALVRGHLRSALQPTTDHEEALD